MNVSLKEKLKRYKEQKRAERVENGQPAPMPPEQHRQNDSENTNESIYRQELTLAAEQMNAEIKGFEDQFVFVRTEQLDVHERIGPYPSAELFDIVSDWQRESSVHPLSSFGLGAEDLLFFDTETTGLGAGSGHMIFLIGFARVTRSCVTLKQYFLPGPGHEAAFYYYFFSDCRHLKNLVTYNGKAFDWPRVKTRHQFVRNRVPRLPAFGHFDLLHASRRLWKNRLDGTRLQTVEKEILGLDRGDDVPGSMAPFLYFQFLKQPKAALVKGIMEHNLEDIKALIALYIHLSKKVLGSTDRDEEETFEIARWYYQLGEAAQAQVLFESLAETDSPAARKAQPFLGYLYKKQGNFKRALTVFQSLIRRGTGLNERIYIEAAKLLEHQFKDYRGAKDYTQRAIDQLKEREQSSGQPLPERKRDYLKRYRRLDEKLAR
ncbi:ribonuclease H-like domain-containing protein [Terrilactibacillus sp. S3-3]|nr:ribonuclease H-like domain-containing protein [Terrilactibacillus sp. S3-3]